MLMRQGALSCAEREALKEASALMSLMLPEMNDAIADAMIVLMTKQCEV